MSRDDILERHYSKARKEVAILFALVPLAIAIFVIVFAAGIDRPRAGGMFYAALCVAPLLLLRDQRVASNLWIAVLLGLAFAGAAGFLATGAIWVTVVTGALGALAGWLYQSRASDTSKMPKLNAVGLARLNADLNAAGFDEV